VKQWFLYFLGSFCQALGNHSCPCVYSQTTSVSCRKQELRRLICKQRCYVSWQGLFRWWLYLPQQGRLWPVHARLCVQRTSGMRHTKRGGRERLVHALSCHLKPFVWHFVWPHM
jgi:hypothetical protein